MNIKRTFLAAVAVLMVPSLALAQVTLRFDTGVNTTNGANVSVDYALVCSTGLDSSQNGTVTTALNQEPVVIEVVLDGDEFCHITFSNLPAGYTFQAGAGNRFNSDAVESQTPPHCTWDNARLLAQDAPGEIFGEVPYEGEGQYQCELNLEPVPFTFSVTKEWEVLNDNVIDLNAQVRWVCQNVATTTYGEFGNQQGSFNFQGPNTDTASRNFFASPAGTSRCRAFEDNVDSSIETDNGCDEFTTFALGDGTKGCTITNTVFYEGIPTLSQYGLAIMALLMLGVGFIGFRRFV